MEQKTKAIAAALEIEESKLTNPVLSKKLKQLKLDGTGAKEALTNRLFEAMELGPIKKDELPKPQPVTKEEIQARIDELVGKDDVSDEEGIELQELDVKLKKFEEKPKVEPKKNNGLKKTAGFYAKYMAGRNNVANQESPIFNFDDLKHVRTLVLPHAQAVELNAQKLNSGIIYKEVESKTSK